jgi:RHS repeat-associated protein
MVAINEILLRECAGEECGGDNNVRSDSRVHHRNAENRAPVTRNHRSAPILGCWLSRDPIGYQGGINLYGYANSSPVGNVDAVGEIWWPNTTPNVVVNQNGLPSLHLFVTTENQLSNFTRLLGETSAACHRRAQALYERGKRYAGEVASQAIAVEAYALYQEGVLQNLQSAEQQANNTLWITLASVTAGPAAEAVNSNLFSWIGKPLSSAILLGGTAASYGYNIYTAATEPVAAVPPQYRPEQLLYRTMMNALFSDYVAATARCHCGGK